MKFIIGLLVTAGFMFGCTPQKSSTAATPVAVTYYSNGGSCYSSAGQQVATSYCSNTSTGYYTNGNNCYSSSTGQQVATSFCSTNTNSGYQSSNGSCYSTSTGQQVATSYCSSSNGGTVTNVCYGTYIYNNNGQQQYGTCNGANCRGYTLINAQTGATTYCQ
ncbi:MAG: hypothetical protein K2P92_03370 [Bdellovibrionaceae bacterium]|nr:hypothetical protein [Pseudobdellovibrionaceae bacterium]